MTQQTVLALADIAHPDSALPLLEQVAARHAGDDVHVAYVMPYGFYNYVEPYVSEDSQKAAAERARAALNGLVSKAGLEEAVPHVLRGGIGEQALLLADQIGAGLIILNAVRPGSHHTTLGTHAAQIGRHAKCSVLLRRP